jgi:membrane-bound lytic murein transglycosylase D
MNLSALTEVTDTVIFESDRTADIVQINADLSADEQTEIIEPSVYRNGQDNRFYDTLIDQLTDKKVTDLIAFPRPEKDLDTQAKSVIPLFYNEYVQKQMEILYRWENKNIIADALKRGNPYISQMKEIFKSYGLPEDLVFLAVIESGFNNLGRSRKGATGMWQFMPRTARHMGLAMNDYVDERRDPILACHSAARYLKWLYNLFGDWHLALAAYNRGENGIRRDMVKAGSRHFYELVSRKVPPKETRYYVPRFVALLMLLKNSDKYQEHLLSSYNNFVMFQLPFMSPSHLVAKYAGLELKEFQKLNPAIKSGFVPDPKFKYLLRLPEENYQKLSDNLEELRHDSGFSYMPYFIKKGDNLSTLSRRYGVSVQIIMNVNNLRSAHYLRVGQKIFIPMRNYLLKKKS